MVLKKTAAPQGQKQQQRKRTDIGEHDRHAASAGYETGMQLAVLVRAVDQAEADGPVAHQGCERQAQQERRENQNANRVHAQCPFLTVASESSLGISGSSAGSIFASERNMLARRSM